MLRVCIFVFVFIFVERIDSEKKEAITVRQAAAESARHLEKQRGRNSESCFSLSTAVKEKEIYQ